jgi:voltage-gated potassium channel
MQAQTAARTPRALPPGTSGHIIFTCYDPITTALIPLLEKHRLPFVVLFPTMAEAKDLFEQGVPCAVGDFDDPVTYRNMRISEAAMLVATRADVQNTNIIFTARELAEHVPIVATATDDAARDVLEIAGATLVLRHEQTMGEALARRVIGNDCAAHVIGEIEGLQIAEANAADTEIEGLTLASSGIRGRTGVSVIGIWDHGRLHSVGPDTPITRQAVLVLAGTREQMERYSEIFSRSCERSHVLIIGGGRVGRVTSDALREAGLSATIIEKLPERVEGRADAIVGDATHIDVLKKARAREARALIVTTHDDNLNISLTIFFRRLREDFQIIARCTMERNAGTLHRAGADLVLSSASMSANIIFNRIRESDNLLLAEGVFVFPSPVPEAMADRPLAESALRSETGCTVIAVEKDGERIVNPAPETILPRGGKLLLIGTLEAEEKFLKIYRDDGSRKAGGLFGRWLNPGART